MRGPAQPSARLQHGRYSVEGIAARRAAQLADPIRDMANLAKAIRKAEREERQRQSQARRSLRQMWRAIGLD